MLARATIVLSLAAAASPLQALTGSVRDGQAEPRAFSLTAASQAQDFVSALQLPKATAGALGLALSGEPLLGRFGLTPAAVLAELAPNLNACTLKATGSQARGEVVHEYYDVYFGDYPLVGGLLHLHHLANRLVMVRAALPTYHLPPEPFTAADFLPLSALGLADVATGGRQTARQVIAEASGFPTPAWEVTRFDPETGSTRQLLVDARTAAVLSSVETAFDLAQAASTSPAAPVAPAAPAAPVAQVYEKGPADSKLITVSLPDLPTTGYLDGKHLAVFAPSVADPRVQAQANAFDFHPDDPAEALSFDQVQSYYGATRALAWFQTKFGYDIGTSQIVLRVNDLVGGVPDNAMYVPPPNGPEIQIGRGNDHLTNLARDSAVVSHEFSHHIIYEHLKVHTGESGILHEGTADYFAYAINGDPCLGKSIVVGGGCLRTALLDPALRFDGADPEQGPHYLGQFWSAVLWELRGKLGEGAGDRLVYDALAYLGPTSGIRDAFLALLNADRDQSPQPIGAADAGIFGLNKCLILDAGVRRGFASYLGEFNGLSCGLNLVQLAQESRDLASGTIPPHGPKMDFTLFGRTCAVTPLSGGNGGGGGPRPGGQTAWATWLLLALPALTAALTGARPRRRRHGP